MEQDIIKIEEYKNEVFKALRYCDDIKIPKTSTERLRELGLIHTVDICKEYELIKDKKSKLSKADRDIVSKYISRIEIPHI